MVRFFVDLYFKVLSFRSSLTAHRVCIFASKREWLSFIQIEASVIRWIESHTVSAAFGSTAAATTSSSIKTIQTYNKQQQ
ncbi:hypothetical protein HanXRQr2_Chr03g0101811 [Helianthus annuus]|uniref:Uncharacterized protein n=1 Tax=Helianthus annuus TaxID=4232 RepID=A0A9K3JFQ5_HELAN|nr:hypothetical protein HanXRQr2_Chr03g0101811 [Helianthus annuus]